MPSQKHLEILDQGGPVWNAWREKNPQESVRDAMSELASNMPMSSKTRQQIEEPAHIRMLNLSGANLKGRALAMVNFSCVNLSGAKLQGADLSDADFTGASLHKADLTGANIQETIFSDADLTKADLRRARFFAGADLQRAKLRYAKLEGVELKKTNLRGADLTLADLRNVDLTEADLREATFYGTDIRGATLARAMLNDADVTGIRWTRRRMRGCYLGIRGLESCYGNALFKRDAADQDFLDTLAEKWRYQPQMALFWLWGALDYGRSLSRVVWVAAMIAFSYGLIYSYRPELLNFKDSANTLLTPFYFSVVTYTTLGFGDVKPANKLGELLVMTEVVIGYLTLGLLLAVLAEKVARRS